MYLLQRSLRKIVDILRFLLPNNQSLKLLQTKLKIKISSDSFRIKRQIDSFFSRCLFDGELSQYRLLVRKSFSQCRQDLIIGLINDLKPGLIIEVGATDGLFLSNSLLLEKGLGYSSILVEPGVSWRTKLIRNRVTAKLIFKAVYHSSDLQVYFTESDYAELSGLTASLPLDYWSTERESSNQYLVSTVTLDQICDENYSGEKFLVVTIDIEGGEIDAIKGFEKNIHQASLLVIENNGNSTVVESLDLKIIPKGFVRLNWPFESFDSWYVSKNFISENSLLCRLIREGAISVFPAMEIGGD